MIHSLWNGKRVTEYFIEEIVLEPRLEGHQNLPLEKDNRGVQAEGHCCRER